MVRRWLLAIITLLLYCGEVSAQHIGIGYWDVESLYDTIPSRFYDDTEWTPLARRGWNSSRYADKVAGVAALLDSMALPVVGLYGVETEGVARDIAQQSQLDYSYLLSTNNSLDGLNFVLFYFGDTLFPERVDSMRNLMAIEAHCTTGAHPITIIMSRSGEALCNYIEDISPLPEEHLIVALGNIYLDQPQRLSLMSPLEQSMLRGRGNYLSRRGWIMRDVALVSTEANVADSGVYITPWLLTADGQQPCPTFDGADYMGGLSSFLPIYLYLY